MRRPPALLAYVNLLSRRRWRRWPESVAGGHHVGNHYAFLLDALVMSVRTAAPRHGLDRDRGHALFAAFCRQFWLAARAISSSPPSARPATAAPLPA